MTASWYAQGLIDLSEQPDLHGVRPVRCELIYRVVSLAAGRARLRSRLEHRIGC
jgi:hypothetical protein